MVLILVASIYLAVHLVGVLRQVDWYQYRPASWVFQDLSSNNPPVSDRAWTELQRRFDAGSLSKSMQAAFIDRCMVDLDSANAATRTRAWTELKRRVTIGHCTTVQTDALIDRCLREQQTGGQPGAYMSEMVEFLGARYIDHLLSSAQSDRFFDNCLTMQLKVKPIIGFGDPVPISLSSVGRGPANGWWTQSRELGWWVDEQRVDKGLSNGRQIGFGLGGYSTQSNCRPGPGKHRFRIDIEVGAGRGDLSAARGPMEHVQVVSVTADFEVLPDGAPLTRLTEPAASVIAKCITAEQFEIDPARSKNRLSGQIRVQNAPVDMAFEIYARIDGTEYPLGPLDCQAGRGKNLFATNQKPVPAGIRNFDLVLRSSEEVARKIG